MDENSPEQYVEPSIVDYGSVSEMTAGQNFREYTDGHMPSGNVLIGATTGPCNKYVNPELCTP